MGSRTRLVSGAGVGFDLRLQPQAVRHYLKLGIERDAIHVALNSPEKDSEGLTQAVRHLRSFDIDPVKAWIDPYTSRLDVGQAEVRR